MKVLPRDKTVLSSQVRLPSSQARVTLKKSSSPFHLWTFQTSQISVAPSRAQHSWYEPVNWFTKEQEIWTVTTFTFAFTPPRMQSCQLISTWRQNVKLQVWNQPNFYTTPSHSTITITDPISALTGLLWNNIDSNGYLWFLGSTLW